MIVKRLGVLLCPLVFAAACGDGSAESGPSGVSEDHQLIGGRPATLTRFPATLHIAAGCTAAKVAPKRILTAAHCVFDPNRLEPKYGPNKPIKLSRTPVQGHTEVAVVAVHVHPKWKSACAESYCAASAVTAKLDAPDVAVVELADDLTEVPSAPIDPAPLAPGDAVQVLGFGCTEGVHVADHRGEITLLFADADIAPAAAAIHEGSPVTRTDLPVYGGNYALTGGPGSAVNAAGLCPGDSGGPVYAQRGSTLAIVGVNANYTLKPDAADEHGKPVTNWHTRLDNQSRNGVAEWLRSIGALPVERTRAP